MRLKLNLHYDSSSLIITEVNNQISASKVSNNTLGNEESDLENLDENSITDKFISFNWEDNNESWPGVDLPVTLAKVKFKISENVDQESQSTLLSLTSDNNASGYSFEGYSLLLGGEQGFENEYFSNNFNSSDQDGIEYGNQPHPGGGMGSGGGMGPGPDHDPFSIPDISELTKVGSNREDKFQQKGDALYLDKDTNRIFILKDDNTIVIVNN